MAKNDDFDNSDNLAGSTQLLAGSFYCNLWQVALKSGRFLSNLGRFWRTCHSKIVTFGRQCGSISRLVSNEIKHRRKKMCLFFTNEINFFIDDSYEDTKINKNNSFGNKTGSGFKTFF